MVVTFQIMPPKARIDEQSFPKALRALPSDELNLLDSSSTTGAVWSHICLSMGKPDNTENRRACLGHFMKNVRKNASKDLSKKQVIHVKFSCDIALSLSLHRLHLACG